MMTTIWSIPANVPKSSSKSWWRQFDQYQQTFQGPQHHGQIPQQVGIWASPDTPEVIIFIILVIHNIIITNMAKFRSIIIQGLVMLCRLDKIYTICEEKNRLVSLHHHHHCQNYPGSPDNIRHTTSKSSIEPVSSLVFTKVEAQCVGGQNVTKSTSRMTLIFN